ncbi:MAG TPA: 50S ribosomal protein L33 [Polyangiaceae bacterium]|nr:50S ribosomal protein L33 [Polyangiaceae bacterium]
MNGSRRPSPARRRVTVALACTICGSRNYRTTKARRDGAGALELRKFCRVCNAHTTHLESR